MKYSELEKLIVKMNNSRFYKTGERHPIWKNPDTGAIFAMSNHKKEEVAPGTLNEILILSGVKSSR